VAARRLEFQGLQQFRRELAQGPVAIGSAEQRIFLGKIGKRAQQSWLSSSPTRATSPETWAAARCAQPCHLGIAAKSTPHGYELPDFQTRARAKSPLA
jgi:hypothetical protein